jgi:hypothetical protein
MPVVEADFLKGLIDPTDRLHASAVKTFGSVRSEGWKLSSAALVELDLLLKTHGTSISDRQIIFETLKSEIPSSAILPLTPEVMAAALKLQTKYSNLNNFYFDSIHLATAFAFDRKIVSSDPTFNDISEIHRIPLETL